MKYLHGSIYTHQSNRLARCLMRPCRACLNIIMGMWWRLKGPLPKPIPFRFFFSLVQVQAFGLLTHIILGSAHIILGSSTTKNVFHNTIWTSISTRTQSIPSRRDLAHQSYLYIEIKSTIFILTFQMTIMITSPDHYRFHPNNHPFNIH